MIEYRDSTMMKATTVFSELEIISLGRLIVCIRMAITHTVSEGRRYGRLYCYRHLCNAGKAKMLNEAS